MSQTKLRHEWTSQSHYSDTGPTMTGSILLMMSVQRVKKQYHFNALGLARPELEPATSRPRRERSVSSVNQPVAIERERERERESHLEIANTERVNAYP